MRLNSLDALRGIAILGMVLSGTIPYGSLPSWMYHAQLPPPEHTFNPNLPGFTWVDLVFPLFLFALGAAIPLALQRRLAKGASIREISLYIVQRAFLLVFFAIFLQHVRPHQIANPPTTQAWLMALAGFVVLFLIFVRLPQSLGKIKTWSLRGAGWLGALFLLIFVQFPDGSGFSLQRSDIIILVLANMYFFGAFIWLATRKHAEWRWAILALCLAWRLSHGEAAWLEAAWNWSPAPWLYKAGFLKYLFIVLPGTMVGEWWMRRKDTNDGMPAVQRVIFSVLAVLMIFLLFAGLHSRHVALTFGSSIALLAAGHFIIKPAAMFFRQTYLLAAFCLILGLIWEPFEGGIKKDPSTMSFYFVTLGMSLLLLLVLHIALDRREPGWFGRVLLNNGRNPMIAYVGMANLIWPLTHLSGTQKIIEQWTAAPWPGFLRGLAFTLMLAWIVHLFTRKKWIWRA